MPTAIGTLATNALIGLGIPTIAGVSAAAIGAAIGNIAFSALVSFALSPSKSSLSQKDIGRELSVPTTQPAYRYVYGNTRATGTLVFQTVKGDFLYTCHLINSRESEGNFKLYLDEREVLLDGDPYDFSLSGGGTGNEYPFENVLTCWFGLGDQTAVPAELLEDIPATVSERDYLDTTDVGEGLTVVWLKLKAGDPEKRVERWPSSPPSVMVEGDFSKVYDPRDPLQSLSDKSTWAFSSNHSLCVLDALTQNPFQPYSEDYLLMDQFSEAANYADEVLTKADTTTEARYTVNGTVAFTGGELEDILIPLYTAGAAMPSKVGGRLGIISSEYVVPEYTLTDIIGDFSYSNIKPATELPTILNVSYTSKDRGFTDSALAPYDISTEEDIGVSRVFDVDLSLITSSTQAMRVRKILGFKYRQQVTISCTAPPNAINLVAGTNVTLALPQPFNRFDGVYTVSSCHPFMDLVGNEGVALRNSLVLVSTSSAIDNWESSEEEVIFIEEYDSTRSGVRPPSNISVTTGEGVDRNNGGSIIPRFRFAFDPSPSTGVTSYSWRFRAGDEGWVNGASIDADNIDEFGKVFGYIDNIDPTLPYDIEISAVADAGTSDPITIIDVTRVFELTSVIPSDGVAEATFTLTTPTTNFKGIDSYRNTVGSSFETATQIGTTDLYNGGESITHIIASQPVGTYDYWLVPISLTDQEGSISGPYTITIS